MVFSELTLETPVCTLGGKWRGKGEEDKEINKKFSWETKQHEK